MKKPKFKKHPAKMTSAELAEGVFHPKVLKALEVHFELVSVEEAERVLKAAKKPRKRSK